MADSGPKLAALKIRAEARSRAIGHVRAALPPELARAVASAGLEGGILSVGVQGAAWASRLRYAVDILRTQVGDAMGVKITEVRIKVVPPPETPKPR